MTSAVVGLVGAIIVGVLIFAVCALFYAEGERNQRDYHDAMEKP